jgi:hypothetical protein
MHRTSIRVAFYARVSPAKCEKCGKIRTGARGWTTYLGSAIHGSHEHLWVSGYSMHVFARA